MSADDFQPNDELLNILREHHCTKDGLPDFPCWWCRCLEEIERLNIQVEILRHARDIWASLWEELYAKYLDTQNG